MPNSTIASARLLVAAALLALLALLPSRATADDVEVQFEVAEFELVVLDAALGADAGGDPVNQAQNKLQARLQKERAAREAREKQAGGNDSPAAKQPNVADAVKERLRRELETYKTNRDQAQRMREQQERQREQMEKQKEAMIDQNIERYQALLTAELELLRQTCDLPPEIRPQIKAAVTQALRVAVAQEVEANFMPRQVNARRDAVDRNNPPGPRKTLHDEVLKALREVLPAEQLAVYEEESRLRIEDRKQAVILVLITSLTDSLYLTIEQQELIAASLEEEWRDGWEAFLMLHQYAGRYLPNMHEQPIIDHLTPEQKDVFRSIQKIGLSYYEMHDGVPQEDDGWWGDEADDQAARKARNLAVPAAVAY